jgi:hypothetical protein
MPAANHDPLSATTPPPPARLLHAAPPALVRGDRLHQQAPWPQRGDANALRSRDQPNQALAFRLTLLETSALTHGTVQPPSDQRGRRRPPALCPPVSPPAQQTKALPAGLRWGNPTQRENPSDLPNDPAKRPPALTRGNPVHSENPPNPPKNPAKSRPAVPRGDPKQTPAPGLRPGGEDVLTPPEHAARGKLQTPAPLTWGNLMHRENRMHEPVPVLPPEGENPLPHPATPWHRLRDTCLRATVLLYETLRVPGVGPRPSAPPNAPQPHAPSSTPGRNPMQPEKPPTGLRNNNPRGDPNTAPRCGARTRAGTPCRSPAMPNGRCRMHGGRSTGPRTIEGLNRLRAATTKHGAYATSAARRFRDPDDPFARQSLRMILKGTRETLDLIRRAGPEGPDPAALLALLIPDPIPIRRRKRTAPGASLPSGARPESLSRNRSGRPHAP